MKPNKTSFPCIFEYFDYAKFLRDCYEKLHEDTTYFSYKYIQKKTGIDPGYMVKVFQGRKNLAQSRIAPFAGLLQLGKRETEYFNLMVMFGKAKSNDEIKMIFEKMLPYTQLGSRRIESNAYEYYTKWYYAAVREILNYWTFAGDYRTLASMTVPEITVREARKAIALLKKLDFIRPDETGGYMITSRFITTGEEWGGIAVRQFQKDTIMLAHQALDNVPAKQRDISTVTVSLSEEGFCQVREKLRQTRREVLEIARREQDADGAYHLNLQLFPVGRRSKGDT